MPRAVISTVGFLVMLSLALFVPAGSMRWPAAWASLLFFLAYSIVGLLVLDLALIEERTSLPPNSKALDMALAGSAFIFLFPITLIVCGLDFRFGWSAAIPAAMQWAALVVVMLGYAFSLWAACTNPFFSTVVRIQKERGHHVIDTGPYGLVRHPGYAGPLIAHAVLPIALGSFWALVPTIGGAVLLMIRAAYEERRLAVELPGYAEYMLRVHWRLFPGLW